MSSTSVRVANHLLKPDVAEHKVPHWLRRHADLWIKIPGVEAVVLFGSRAVGSANENSDWDVAIVHSESKPKDIPMHRDFSIHHVDVPLISLRKYVEESHSVGTLAHELAVTGDVLAGSVPPFDYRRLVVGKEELARHVEFAFHGLAMAIAEIAVDMSHGDPNDSLDHITANYSSAPSANGAERIAKALCVHLGVTYRHTHSVRELAELVPEEWRAKVLATEGNTSDAHVSPYEGTSESVEDVAKRISVSFDLLQEVLPPICKQLSSTLIANLDVKIASFTGVNRALDLSRAQDANLTVVELVGRMERARELLQRQRRASETKRGQDASI